jgi:hypothetical protein
VADFDDIDALLSSSLKSAAEPANSAGVADLIRSRVAAGDAGTSVAGSVAPGWGGGASGILTIVAPIALIVGAGVAGGALGASGIVGAPEAPRSGDVPAYVTTEQVAPAYVCPGGPEIGRLPAGTRVLAVARDADGAYLGVRNPSDVNATLWFSTADVDLDEGGVDPATLPVLGCPEVTVTVVTPTPTPEPTQEPTPEPTKPPGDTTPPAINQYGANPTTINSGGCSLNSTVISAYVVTDNVGVTSVSATWTSAGGGSASLNPTGQSWSFTYTAVTGYHGSVVITLVARDAAGNQSAPRQVPIAVNSDCIS